MAWTPASGDRRCHAKSHRTGEQCRLWGIAGTDPPVCQIHGGSAPQVRAKAAKRLQEQQATQLARRSLAGTDLSRYADPFAALEFAVSYSYALAERLALIVDRIPDDQLRYQGKIGEQLRGEVAAVQKSLDTLRGAATDSLKLGLAERRLGIRQQTADMLDRALAAALERAGLGVDGQARAREEFRRRLQIVAVGDDTAG